MRERGLKFIDMFRTGKYNRVAPVRERGLNFQDYNWQKGQKRRSREGAWIEIVEPVAPVAGERSLP